MHFFCFSSWRSSSSFQILWRELSPTFQICFKLVLFVFFCCFLSTVATLCFLRKYLFTMYRGCYVKICAIMLTSHPYKLQDIPSIPGDLLITFILSISNTWGYIILTASLLDKRVKLNELFSSCSVPCSLSLVNKFLKPPTECFA